MVSVMASDGRGWVIAMVTMTFGVQRCLVVQGWKCHPFVPAAQSDSSQDAQNVKWLQMTTIPVRTLGSFSMKTSLVRNPCRSVWLFAIIARDSVWVSLHVVCECFTKSEEEYCHVFWCQLWMSESGCLPDGVASHE